jgi:hypothetical protein
MLKNTTKFNWLNILLLCFYVFIWLFTTLHLLAFGAGESKNTLEKFSVILPDIFLLIIFFVACYVYSTEKMNFFRIKNLTSFDKLFISFFLFNTILGFLISMNLKLSIYGFRITYLPMLFYFIGRVYGNNTIHIEKLLHKLFLIFAFFGAIGLVIYFGMSDFQSKMMSMTGYQPTSYFILRMTSILWTPVLFGFLMALTLVYFYFRILTLKKWIDYLFFCICWVCLFLTVSRGPILAFTSVFLLMTFFYKEWKYSFLTVVAIIISTFIVNTIIFRGAVSLLWIFQSAADTASFSDGVTRVMRWKISLHDLSQQPWGFGLGKAGATAYRFLLQRPVPCAPYSTDGWYLKLACESGIQGMLFYFILFGFYFLQAGKYVLKNKPSLITFIFSAFLLVSIHEAASNTLDYYPFITIYWLLLGYSINFIFPRNNGQLPA